MPPKDRFGTSDWQQLRHWKYCVGGKYNEVRRLTTTSSADGVMKGFDVGASAAGLLHVVPGVGNAAAFAAQGIIVGLKWTLGKLGVFTKREPSYKLIRSQFKLMFQKELQIPIIPLTKTDWCLAAPEIPPAAISEILEAYRKHILTKFGMKIRLQVERGIFGASWKNNTPPSAIKDKDNRHYMQAVDWLYLYEVDKLPYKIEWVFAFGAADEVSMDACRAVGTDLAKLSASERDSEIAKLREQGKIPGKDLPEPEPDPDAGEPDEEAGFPVLPIAVAAGILAIILLKK